MGGTGSELIALLSSPVASGGTTGLFEDQANVDRSVMLEMHAMLTYEKQFKNLQLQESRLARRREKEMAELLNLQQARKVKEAVALDSATRAYVPARHRNQPFDLAALGFEFSKQRFDAHLAGLGSAPRAICSKKPWPTTPKS